MSIINDALKKTGSYLQKNTTDQQSPKPATPAPKPFLLYILILVAGLFLGNLIFGMIKNKIQAGPARPGAKKAAPAPAETITPALEPAQTNPPVLSESKAQTADFILSGIFLSDGESYALINNKIVRENDSVDGAKVETIGLTSVELDNAGQKIKLTTNR